MKKILLLVAASIILFCSAGCSVFYQVSLNHTWNWDYLTFNEDGSEKDYSRVGWTLEIDMPNYTERDADGNINWQATIKEPVESDYFYRVNEDGNITLVRYDISNGYLTLSYYSENGDTFYCTVGCTK